ncbi:MAG TPA: hypothetical protein ENK57_26245 [Polyangiaceae bacterium]|nr:hypothetical protein [Polyangiaceae bacterium]
MADEPTFPETVDSDSDDVSWALETGRTMWAQGDHKEGLKWLKRAADTASEEEDDMRSLTLAKAAADLRNFVEESHGAVSATPPPVDEAGDDGAGKGEEGDKKRSLPVPKKTLPKKTLPKPTASAPASSGSSPPSSPPSSRPAAPATASRPAPQPPKPSRPAPASSAPGSSEAPPASIDDGRPTVVQPMRSKSIPAGRPKSSAHRDAVRVAIAPHPNAINSWVARPLPDGEQPHAGERLGLLVALDGEALGLS